MNKAYWLKLFISRFQNEIRTTKSNLVKKEKFLKDLKNELKYNNWDYENV